MKKFFVAVLLLISSSVGYSSEGKQRNWNEENYYDTKNKKPYIPDGSHTKHEFNRKKYLPYNQSELTQDVKEPNNIVYTKNPTNPEESVANKFDYPDDFDKSNYYTGKKNIKQEETTNKRYKIKK